MATNPLESLCADIWGAGEPFSAALAAALRARGVDATTVDTIGGRLGGPPQALIFPVFDGRIGEEAKLRRERLTRDAVRLAAALADGQIGRLIVLSSTSAYGTSSLDGSGPYPVETSPLAAVEGATVAADARAVEAILGDRPAVTILRLAEVLGPGCEAGLLARHLAGPRLLVVRGSAPRWQVCHVDDVAAALRLVLGMPPGSPVGPAVVASRGSLDQHELELASGRKRLDLPLVVAEATAARLHRTRLAPGAGDELPYLTAPCVVEPECLPALGFEAEHSAAEAVRAHQAGTIAALAEPSMTPVGDVMTGAGSGTRPQAVRLARATVAAVGSAALLRRARRSRGR